MKTPHAFIVDYAYGFHANTCEVDYVCKLRCEAALRALKDHPDAHIVLGAGMKEQTGDCGPLATMMDAFLIEHRVPKARILRNPHGRDTLSETEAAYWVIGRYGDGKVICATSRFHAPRVWCIWLCRFGIVPVLYTSGLKASLHECYFEALKIPRDVARALLHRIRYGTSV